MGMRVHDRLEGYRAKELIRKGSDSKIRLHMHPYVIICLYADRLLPDIYIYIYIYICIHTDIDYVESETININMYCIYHT